jgi:hypothetical protein
MIRIGRRVEASDERERPRVTAARLRAAGGVAADDESARAVAEVAAVRRIGVDVPDAGEADAVRMEQAAIAFPVTRAIILPWSKQP